MCETEWIWIMREDQGSEITHFCLKQGLKAGTPLPKLPVTLAWLRCLISVLLKGICLVVCDPLGLPVLLVWQSRALNFAQPTTYSSSLSVSKRGQYFLNGLWTLCCLCLAALWLFATKSNIFLRPKDEAMRDTNTHTKGCAGEKCKWRDCYNIRYS